MLSRHQQFLCAPDNLEYVEITCQNRLKVTSKLRILPAPVNSKPLLRFVTKSNLAKEENNSDRNVSIIAEG